MQDYIVWNICPQPVEFLSDMYLTPYLSSPPPLFHPHPYEILVEPAHLFDNNNCYLPVITEEYFGYV